ncbi:MAG: metallopeptidase family protein [Acidimicrobiales bacterium]|jgi:predicted Zn-dependent protease with MMP-like domain
MVVVSRKRFEEMVGEAFDELPDEAFTSLGNVAVLVEDDPPEPGLLGLYEGVPITERGDDLPGLPDRIFIYRRSICDMCHDAEEVAAEVRITVFHEVAHHLGLDDDRLHELGWG